MRAVAKHSTALAQAVVDSGALECLVQCLEEFDPSVKEASAWALSYIAKYRNQLIKIKLLLKKTHRGISFSNLRSRGYPSFSFLHPRTRNFAQMHRSKCAERNLQT